MSVDEQPAFPSGFDFEPTAPFRFSLRSLLLFVTCFAIALGVLRWLSVAVGNARAAAREIQCANNMHQIGMAIQIHCQEKGFLPPAYEADAQGKPLYSWRGLVLLYLESRPTWPTPGTAWNGPANASLAHSPIFCYHCPVDESPLQITSYVAVTGPHTAWPGKALKLRDFKNPSKTILFVELHDSKINWLEPRDLDISELARVKLNCNGGFHACFADGHVELLPAEIDLKELAAMCDPEGS